MIMIRGSTGFVIKGCNIYGLWLGFHVLALPSVELATFSFLLHELPYSRYIYLAFASCVVIRVIDYWLLQEL